MTVALSVCAGARRSRREAHPRIESFRDAAIFKALPMPQEAFLRIRPERLSGPNVVDVITAPV
jgi:hypothetical protein